MFRIYGKRKLEITSKKVKYLTLTTGSACVRVNVCSEFRKKQTGAKSVARSKRRPIFPRQRDGAPRPPRREGGRGRGEREVNNAYRFWSRTDAVESQTDRRPLKNLSNFRGEIEPKERKFALFPPAQVT